VRSRFLTALLAAGLVLGSFAAGNYASGQSGTKGPKWEYTVLRHSPHLKEGGTDFGKIQKMGKNGWALASSYPVKGEIVISVFKRQK